MKTKSLIAFAALAISTLSFAQEVQYANIVSVTPLTDQVPVIKSNCQAVPQERSFLGMVVGMVGGAAVGKAATKSNTGMVVGAGVGAYAGDAIDNAMRQQEFCHQVQTYEPKAGGYQIVYELGGQQYTVRSNTFPRGNKIAVQMTPTPVQ